MNQPQYMFDASTKPSLPWHEGVFPTHDHQRFLDRQGAVHARVSADIGTEFGVYLSCPLRAGRIRNL